MTTELVNLVSLSAEGQGSGALWGEESHDLDYTLVAWPLGQGVAKHANNEVDVLMLVLIGTAKVEVNGKAVEIPPSGLLLIPVGSERSIEALTERLVYLNVHKRKKKLGMSNVEAFRERVRPD